LGGPWDYYALVKPGSYQVFVGSQDSTRAAPYSFGIVPNIPFPTGCFYLLATTGVSATVATSNASCAGVRTGATGTFYTQAFLMAAPAGSALTITVSSTDFSPLFEIYNGTGTVLLATTAAQTGNQVTATASIPADSPYQQVYVTSRTALQFGSFTVTIAP
jgi:hypothetical protein